MFCRKCGSRVLLKNNGFITIKLYTYFIDKNTVGVGALDIRTNDNVFDISKDLFYCDNCGDLTLDNITVKCMWCGKVIKLTDSLTYNGDIFCKDCISKEQLQNTTEINITTLRLY